MFDAITNGWKAFHFTAYTLATCEACLELPNTLNAHTLSPEKCYYLHMYQ